MAEEFLAMVVPSDRALEQAIVALKKGAHLLKCGRRGKPKFCPIRLSTDERFLIWYSGEEEKQIRLSSATNVIRGQRTKQLQAEKECQSISLIYANGEKSLDLICKDIAQADVWFLGLKAVISRCHRPRSFGSSRNRRGAQSCINSPAGLMRRKHNMGLLEETAKISQVCSQAGSPAHSFSERCFSDGLSCSSDSFYSESSHSSMQNVTDMLIPISQDKESDYLKKQEAISIGTKIRTNVFSRFVKPAIEKDVLRDVFIWGEGIERGYLGGGIEHIDHNRMLLDALLPKLLESIVLLDVRNISLGRKHAALVTKQGEVFCWGEGKRGRLGHKIDMDITFPQVIESLTGVCVKSISCGEYQTCALTHSGEVYTWGDNCYGIDSGGQNKSTTRWLPHRLSVPLDGVSVSSVACGEWHTAVVSTSGQLFTWGDGTFGVLGHGNCKSFSQPREVESLKGLWVKSAACGPWHTAAIVEIMVDSFKFDDPGGKLFTWGDGDKGRLGHADHERKLLPTCVAQLVDHDFIQVSCGRMLTVGLTNRGTVYTMGSAAHGQLGNPQARDKSITIVEGKLKDSFITKISSGSYHIAALTSRGSVYTWGKGANGQLGLGDTEDRSSPTLVEALKDRRVESITCGSNSTAVICLHKSIFGTDQSTCRGCSMGFGFTRKKHNCYNCGHLFCHACSSKKATDAGLAPNKSKAYRVCYPCFEHLQRAAHSCRLSKLEDRSPRLLLASQKVSYLKKDGSVQLISTGDFCDENQCSERKTTKQPGLNVQPLDPSSYTNGELPRWGQVPCPQIFNDYCRELPRTAITESSNQLSCNSPVCAPDMPLESKYTISTTSVERNSLESDEILSMEVQKLRTEAESLERLCRIRSEKILKCEQKLEETWSLAKEEAAKCKAAKEVIKALTSRLHTMSEKLSAERVARDQVGLDLHHFTSLHSDSPIQNHLLPLVVATCVPPEAGQIGGRKIDSRGTSPIGLSNSLKSTPNRDMQHDDIKSAGELCARRTDSGQSKIKALKPEWIEQYQPGVYITFITLPSGQKGLKRVRFSRKKFTENEAKRWWDENQLKVYRKYDIEGYTDSIEDVI